MNLSELLNILLGIYGAGTTTYIIIKQNEARKRKLSVKISSGWIPQSNGRLGPEFLFITVANPGNRDVTINVPYLELPDKKTLVTPVPLTNVRFPYRLKEGENCSIWIEINEIKNRLKESGYKGIVELKACVSDATGKIYSSRKKYKFVL